MPQNKKKFNGLTIFFSSLKQDVSENYSLEIFIDIDGTMFVGCPGDINCRLVDFLARLKYEMSLLKINCNFHFFTRRSKQEMERNLKKFAAAGESPVEIMTAYILKQVEGLGLKILTVSTEGDLIKTGPSSYYEELKDFENNWLKFFNEHKNISKVSELVQKNYSDIFATEKKELGNKNVGKVLQFQQLYTHLKQRNSKMIAVVIDDLVENLDALSQFAKKEESYNLILMHAKKHKTENEYWSELSQALKKFEIDVDLVQKPTVPISSF